MVRLVLFISLLLVFACGQAEVVITPNEVYAQALLIEKETYLIKNFLQIKQAAKPVTLVQIDIKPRHVWQEGYMLQMKLIMFRRKHHLAGMSPVVIEPSEEVDPRLTWAQTQRILSEIRIIRRLLEIPGDVGPAPIVAETKKPIDVFNKMAQIEAEWDVLIGTGFDASYTFDQVWRFNEDVDALLRHLNIFDSAVPPAKNSADTPTEALDSAFLALEQVQRLQRLADLPTTDFSALRKTENISPDDTFNLVCLTLAEMQQIKARIGLLHNITPPAPYHQHKNAADVRQFLGYIHNKLALIEHL